MSHGLGVNGAPEGIAHTIPIVVLLSSTKMSSESGIHGVPEGIGHTIPILVLLSTNGWGFPPGGAGQRKHSVGTCNLIRTRRRIPPIQATLFFAWICTEELNLRRVPIWILRVRILKVGQKTLKSGRKPASLSYTLLSRILNTLVSCIHSSLVYLLKHTARQRAQHSRQRSERCHTVARDRLHWLGWGTCYSTAVDVRALSIARDTKSLVSRHKSLYCTSYGTVHSTCYDTVYSKRHKSLCGTCWGTVYSTCYGAKAHVRALSTARDTRVFSLGTQESLLYISRQRSTAHVTALSTARDTRVLGECVVP